jgi:hypothetical protein
MAPITFMNDFFKIYSYGETKDKVQMAFAVILALGSGVALPLATYIWGLELDHLLGDIRDL